MSTTKIEWTHVPGYVGRVWNPMRGCTKISQGCKHCYAERWYTRFGGTVPFTAIQLYHDKIDTPRHWKKPAVVFVNSMSDLFHDNVPDEFIARVFKTMLDANWHKYIVLTKRAQRMNCFLNHYLWDALPNHIAIGVSVENQETADERVPYLLDAHVSLRVISAEPLLDAVSMPWLSPGWHDGPNGVATPGIDWLIVGGESGPGARRMFPEWARALRDEAFNAGAAFFFKQWGEHDEHGLRVGKRTAGRVLDSLEHNGFPRAWVDGGEV